LTENELPNYPIIKSNSPKCVILGAGSSSRLRPLTDAMPKCLLKVGGKTLLERTIGNVIAAGIKEIAIVVGYRAEMIRDFVKQHFPQQRIRLILNPNYTCTNNAYSLLLARRFLEDRNRKVNNDLLLLDSDILFSGKLLPYFLNIEVKNKIAVRILGEHNEEEIQVVINSYGNINFIGKKSSLIKTPCESIGIELFSAEAAARLFSILEQRVQDGKGKTEFYEAAIQELIDGGAVLKAADVSTFPTIEIDTPEDLELAEQLNVDE